MVVGVFMESTITHFSEEVKYLQRVKLTAPPCRRQNGTGDDFQCVTML